MAFGDYLQNKHLFDVLSVVLFYFLAAVSEIYSFLTFWSAVGLCVNLVISPSWSSFRNDSLKECLLYVPSKVSRQRKLWIMIIVKANEGAV